MAVPYNVKAIISIYVKVKRIKRFFSLFCIDPSITSSKTLFWFRKPFFFFKAVFVQVFGLFSFSTRRSVNVNPKGTHVAVQKLVNEIAKMLINSGTEVNFIKNG